MTQSEVLEQFNVSWQLAEKHVPAIVGSGYMKRCGWKVFTADLLNKEQLTQDEYNSLTNPF